MSADRPIPSAGVVCWRDEDVLLIRRSKPPFAGRWSIPGGRIRAGERAPDAALRELREETGVEAEILGLIDVVDAIGTSGHFILIDYAARWTGGEPRPGDDAAEAVFVSRAEAAARLDWDETRRVLEAGRAIYDRARGKRP
ncbi:phosphohydrolase [Marinicauda salina]|uniref:Phosphohydrolase n=1 Tax=Marinicauda salina TaxID=2135793 RepID=A0A2U2BUG9_9PROT|nr:NUDIX hydrolase [Marinicauda salina]PWE17604.1 phosphohydrolase [Marinicauda salina]